MKILFRQLSLLLLAFLVLQSCHFNSSFTNREEDKIDGEKVTNEFYTLMKGKEYSAAYSLFSKKFFEATDTGKLNNIFTASENKLGSIDTISLENWQTVTVKGSDPKSEYLFSYEVKRKHFSSKEEFTMTKEGGKIKIVGYRVNSDGFFAPEKK